MAVNASFGGPTGVRFVVISEVTESRPPFPFAPKAASDLFPLCPGAPPTAALD
jgi:hypothetical protein